MGESGNVGFYQHVYMANNCVYILEYNLSAFDWVGNRTLPYATSPKQISR